MNDSRAGLIKEGLGDRKPNNINSGKEDYVQLIISIDCSICSGKRSTFPPELLT